MWGETKWNRKQRDLSDGLVLPNRNHRDHFITRISILLESKSKDVTLKAGEIYGEMQLSQLHWCPLLTPSISHHCNVSVIYWSLSGFMPIGPLRVNHDHRKIPSKPVEKMKKPNLGFRGKMSCALSSTVPLEKEKRKKERSQNKWNNLVRREW